MLFSGIDIEGVPLLVHHVRHQALLRQALCRYGLLPCTDHGRPHPRQVIHPHQVLLPASPVHYPSPSNYHRLLYANIMDAKIATRSYLCRMRTLHTRLTRQPLLQLLLSIIIPEEIITVRLTSVDRSPSSVSGSSGRSAGATKVSKTLQIRTSHYHINYLNCSSSFTLALHATYDHT